MQKFLLIIVLLITKASWAGGFGFYGIGGAGTGNWSGHGMGDSWLNHMLDVSYGDSRASTTLYGGGLVWDSAVAKDTVFNYRLKAGYERSFMHILGPDARARVDNPIHRYSMSHTFGFGIIRNENARFWIGPRIGLCYFRPSVVSSLFETDTGLFLYFDAMRRHLGNDEFYRLVFATQLVPSTYRYDYIGLNLLWSMGCNFNLGDYVTIFMDFGLGYMGNFSLKANQNVTSLITEASVGMMFRINDRFFRTDNGLVAKSF